MSDNEKEHFRRLQRSFGAPDGGVDEKGVTYLTRREGETDDQFRVRFLEAAKKHE